MNVGCALDEGLARPDEKITVFYGERCVWWCRVEARGKTGHGSRFVKGTLVREYFNQKNNTRTLTLKHRYSNSQTPSCSEQNSSISCCGGSKIEQLRLFLWT